MPKIVNISNKYLHVSYIFCTFARFLNKYARDMYAC